jgi:hypothetical protein
MFIFVKYLNGTMYNKYYATHTQWSNYRRQADIGFFKIIDFMVDMGSFNIQILFEKLKISFLLFVWMLKEPISTKKLKFLKILHPLARLLCHIPE